MCADIVQELGHIERFEISTLGLVATEGLDDVRGGDSIAVEGVGLTVVVPVDDRSTVARIPRAAAIEVDVNAECSGRMLAPQLAANDNTAVTGPCEPVPGEVRS